MLSRGRKNYRYNEGVREEEEEEEVSGGEGGRVGIESWSKSLILLFFFQ